MAKFRFNHFIDIHWNGYNIVGDAGTIFSIPDQLYEEFEEDLRPVEPSLEWTDTNEFQTLTNASAVTGVAPIVSTSTSAGKQVSISSSTSTSGTVLTADGAGGVSFLPQSGGGVAVVGTSPISVVTASGTATVSLNATYSTSTHLHASEYQPLGTYVTSVAGAAPISASTTTAGAATVSVSTGTTSATVAFGDHLHTGTYQPSGTYITAVNGTAPIAVSTTTAGVSTVSLTASYDSAGTAASAVATHEADTTSVHGITNTANLLDTSTSFATIANATATSTTITSTTTTAPTDIAGLSHVFTPTYNEDVVVHSSVVYTQTAASTAIIDLVSRITVNGTIVTPAGGFVRLAANHSSPTGLTLTATHTFAAISGTPYTAKVGVYKTLALGTYTASALSSFTIFRTRA